MTNTIGSVSNQLRADHRNMVLLLDFLEAETDKFSASGEPDYELLGSIMTYIGEYPDTVHHPREDRLYQHLKSLHPDIDASLGRVVSDHKELEEAVAKLRKQIEAVAAGDSTQRDALVHGLQSYAKHLRKHMFWEEQQLFTVAEKLSEEHIVNTDETVRDPLFGRHTEKRFRHLLERIQRHMVWDGQQRS